MPPRASSPTTGGSAIPHGGGGVSRPARPTRGGYRGAVGGLRRRRTRGLRAWRIGALHPAQDRTAGGESFPGYLATGQLSGLEGIVDGIRRDGEERSGHADVKNLSGWWGKGGRWACAGTSGGHMYPFGWNVGDPWRYVPLLRYCRESLKHRGPEMETSKIVHDWLMRAAELLVPCRFRDEGWALVCVRAHRTRCIRSRSARGIAERQCSQIDRHGMTAVHLEPDLGCTGSSRRAAAPCHAIRSRPLTPPSYRRADSGGMDVALILS